jgi:hypothetical protein
MENVIKLQARYGLCHKLEQVAGNCWKLITDPKGGSNYRIIFDLNINTLARPFECKAIDPDGGPFLSVGDTIENYTIERILSNGIIWMKENEISD